MKIHGKINVKGNWFLELWPNNRHEPDFHERFSRIVKRGYSKIMDDYNSKRIYYKQDCKTNYYEPRERDLFEEEQQDIERELRQQDKY